MTRYIRDRPSLFQKPPEENEAGHQDVFWMHALFSFVGSIASRYYFNLYRRPKGE